MARLSPEIGGHSVFSLLAEAAQEMLPSLVHIRRRPCLETQCCEKLGAAACSWLHPVPHPECSSLVQDPREPGKAVGFVLIARLVLCSVLLLPEGADLSSQEAPSAPTARGAPAPPPLEDLSGLLRAATPCGTFPLQ